MGVGQSGRIGLEFVREASNAREAVESALADARRAVPDAKLIGATPDLVGRTDVAEVMDVSRQNMRKLVSNHPSFPFPVHDGQSASNEDRFARPTRPRQITFSTAPLPWYLPCTDEDYPLSRIPIFLTDRLRSWSCEW